MFTIISRNFTCTVCLFWKNCLQIFSTNIFRIFVCTTIFDGFRVSRNKDGSTLPDFTPLLYRIPTESFDITTRQGLPGYLLAANMPLQLQLRWFSALCFRAEALWRDSASVIKPRWTMQEIFALFIVFSRLMRYLVHTYLIMGRKE